MSYQVFVAENKKYITCKVNGPFEIDTARSFASELTILSRQTHIIKFLIDLRTAPNVSSVFQIYEYVNKDMKNMQFQKDGYVALLVSPGDTSHDFVETASINAGFNVRIFTDETLAIGWLIKED